MELHELLATRSEEVMQRWRANVQGTLAPESMPPVELLDHLPEFLQEIIGVLRAHAGVNEAEPRTDQAATAEGHGEQRLRLGFSLDSVVREYGAMRNAIVATARELGANISFDEMQIVFDCTINGIARAVSQYSYERDAELLRHANEHFAFIAHELRNPLSSAIAAVHLLRAQGHLPEPSRVVAALERGLQRTSELIEQTLKVARLASGIDLHREPTTLRALIEDVELDAITAAEAKQIELRVKLQGDEELFVDARLIRSAVSNLLRNAVKYSHPGSPVELRGSVVNRRAVIEIEDGCGGLDPDHVAAAFAPFVRLDSSQSGFGLGLAIAKQAVDAHGGSIRVQNLPGKGCIFVLEFPMGGAAPAQGQRAAGA
jgi:signal transduction histidine kinase